MIGVLLAGFAGLGAQDHQSGMYLPALAAHRGFRVVAVCAAGEADRPRAKQVASDLGIPLATDLDAALGAPGVDLVSVAVPLDQRAGAIVACLRAGKHVLADKPLAGALDDVAAIIGAASSSGRVLLPAHHHRWNGAVRSARAAVAAGRVGLPWNVQADFLASGGQPVAAGELLNLSVYPLDVLRALLGLDAVRVHALSGSYWSGFDDFTTLLVDYANGVTATVALGRTRDIRDVAPGGLARHRYRVSGSHGTLAVDATRPGLSVRTRTEGGTRWVGGGTVAALIDDLHRAVTASAGPPIQPIPLADIADTYRIIDAARRSVRGGIPGEIESGIEGAAP